MRSSQSALSGAGAAERASCRHDFARTVVNDRTFARLSAVARAGDCDGGVLAVRVGGGRAADRGEGVSRACKLQAHTSQTCKRVLILTCVLLGRSFREDRRCKKISQFSFVLVKKEKLWILSTEEERVGSWQGGFSINIFFLVVSYTRYFRVSIF